MHALEDDGRGLALYRVRVTTRSPLRVSTTATRPHPPASLQVHPLTVTCCRILSTKGASTPGGSNRSSRAASPVKAGPGLFSQPQAFQPPSSANSFTFSMGGSQPPPTFGQTPQPNGNSFGTPSQGQPQQNGSMSFGGFGNAQQGTTLSFGAGFGAASTSAQSQPNTFNPSTSINFGQSQPNPTDPSASFQFGQTQNLTQPQTNGSQPSAGGVLGTSFGSQQPQQNGAKPSFSFGQPQPTKEQAPAPSTLSFGGFGQSAQQNGNKPGGTASFGQSVPVQSGTGLLSSSPASETPKNGDSVFSALKPTTNGFKPGMFTQSVPNGDQTPKPFSFGQKEQAATKPASTFTFGQSTPHEGFPPDTEQTPKPAASSFAANFQSQDKPNPSPAVGSGASPSQDASMMSLDTPQKPVSILDGSSEHVQAANPNAGKDLFSRLSPADPPATVPRPSVISAAPSGQASQGMGVARSEEKADAGKDLFSRISRPEPPATEPRPSSIAFPQTATSSVLSAPSFSQAKTTSTSAAPVQQVPAASTTPSTASPDFGKITQLNESLLKHLTTQDPGKDWSVICHYYLTEAAKYCGGDAIPPPPPAVTSNEPRPQASSMTAHVKTPKAPATNMFSQQASSTNLFKPQTPAPSTDPRLRKRGADEQLTKKDSDLSVPATEKRIKPTEPVQYPKLPESASNTAKLFASALDKPVEKSTGGTSFGLAPPPWNAPMTGTKPMGQADDQSGNASMFGPPEDVMAKVREQKAAKEAAERAAANETPAPAPSTTFTPSTTVKFGVAAPAASPAEPVEAPKAPTFGFTPSTSTTNTTGFKPPTSSASSAGGSTNFLAAFGQKANADEEEARKRRREEDYDSEEEDEATWLARDKAEQAEKRRKIEEAARRGSSFSAASATSTASFLSAFGQKANADEEKARKRRWDEDHDSDEEDKATWLARDKAEQAEKRRKIEEAAKSGPSFKLPASADKPAASSTPVAFQPPGAETPAETDSSANAGKSLFDRLGPREETAETSSVNAGKSLFDRLGPRDETRRSQAFSLRRLASPSPAASGLANRRHQSRP